MRAFVLLLMAMSVACTPHHGGGTPADEPTPAEGWRLTVINHHWLDVSVVVLSDAQRFRVGTISATQTQTFDLPSRMISNGRNVRLEANPIGATRVLTTDPLDVRAGQRVEWTLETGLERSSVAIW